MRTHSKTARSLATLTRAVAVATGLFTSQICLADEPELGGLWMETNNYPASSVLRFEKINGEWQGKYAQVSAMQQLWGFKVGEVVIRGSMQGDFFKGEVLLKVRPSTPDPCRGVMAYWAPIELKAAEPGKLYGFWLQTIMESKKRCSVVSTEWQVYGLERLQLN